MTKAEDIIENTQGLIDHSLLLDYDPPISTKTRKTIDICRDILVSGPKSVKFLDRQDTIDIQTANMIVTIYDKLSPERQAKADEVLQNQWGVLKFWEMAGELHQK